MQNTNDAKSAMIEYYSQENPWLLLAQRIVRAHVAQMATNKEELCPSLPLIANISSTKS